MSNWIERLFDFEEGGDVLAEQFNEEFDKVFAAFNSLFQSGVVQASESLGLNTDTSYHDVPGTEKTITVTRASILKVTAVFDTLSQTQLVGTIAVDGTDQTPEARMPADARSTNSQVYEINLSTGSHTIKMRAKQATDVGTNTIQATNTRWSFLVIPDPEP